jgi:MinD-like ATPase involved in chromosome partitioning or flagellar assembly
VAYDVSGSVVKSLGKKNKNNGCLFLIPSSMKTEEITQILTEGYEIEFLNEGFDQLLDIFKLDYLFIDTHPGLNEETLVAIGLSDLSFIIMRVDYQDFQGTAITVAVCRELLERRQIAVVINKILPDVSFSEIKNKIEKSYNISVAATLPETPELLRLGSQELFCLSHSDHPFVKELYNIVNHLER